MCYSYTSVNYETTVLIICYVLRSIVLEKVEFGIPKFETVRRLENVLVKYNFLSHKSTPKKKLAF